MTLPEFSSDYAAARRRFTEAVPAGWSHERHAINARGPGGEELSIDVARWPGADPSRPTLVLTSGVHGAEGRVGSAVQLGYLERFAEAPPAFGVVMVHAVSPHGFAWGRRFDELNVDPNRNFLLDGEEYAGAPPLYDYFAGILNPKTVPGRFSPFVLRAALAHVRFGRAAVRQAVVGGQYDHPAGLFYGGSGPSESHAILKANWALWLAGSSSAWHFDLHTGLGDYAEVTLLLDPTSNQYDRLSGYFGTGVVDKAESAGVSYRARGDFGLWATAHAPPECRANYAYVCLEWGTYGNIDVLKALRRENAAHHAAPGTEVDRAAKAAVAEKFCPADPAWRAAVLRRSAEIIDRVMAG